MHMRQCRTLVKNRSPASQVPKHAREGLVSARPNKKKKKKTLCKIGGEFDF